jgi:RimJ/RimL family protein N-acetyltransferase
MKHSFHVEGFGIRLRPVRLDDAAFIIWLRNLEHVIGRVGDSAADVTVQEAWLEEYFEREGDYYFIAETLGGIPLGTHGIYDVRDNSGETGRFIMRPDVMAGVPVSVMALDLAFGQLGLTELRSSSVSSNLKVHSLHRKSGFKQTGIKSKAQIIDGRPVDLVQFLLSSEDWSSARKGQLPLAELAGMQVLEWSKSKSAVSQPWIRSEKALFPSMSLLMARMFGNDSEKACDIGDAGALEAVGYWCSSWLEPAGAQCYSVLRCVWID